MLELGGIIILGILAQWVAWRLKIPAILPLILIWLLVGPIAAEYITPLVFAVVLTTVLLNATTARLFAKISGVFLKKSEGILIVGVSKFSRLIGEYLTNNGRHALLIDSDENNIKRAKELGIEAFTANIYSDALTDNIELNDVAYAKSGN